jgi:hypothetical protein
LRPANKKRRGNNPAAQAASIIDTMSWRLPERDEVRRVGAEGVTRPLGGSSRRIMIRPTSYSPIRVTRSGKITKNEADKFIQAK